jgi:hypothetical protein
MHKNFNEKTELFSEIKSPKILRKAIFQRIEKEKAGRIFLKKLLLLAGFTVSVVSGIATSVFFGKEILASEFSSLVLLGFSDLKLLGAVWQDYLWSLLETLPAFSIVAILLPFFAFLMLLKQYGKLEQYDQNYSFKH